MMWRLHSPCTILSCFKSIQLISQRKSRVKTGRDTEIRFNTHNEDLSIFPLHSHLISSRAFIEINFPSLYIFILHFLNLFFQLLFSYIEKMQLFRVFQQKFRQFRNYCCLLLGSSHNLLKSSHSLLAAIRSSLFALNNFHHNSDK